MSKKQRIKQIFLLFGITALLFPACILATKVINNSPISAKSTISQISSSKNYYLQVAAYYKENQAQQYTNKMDKMLQQQARIHRRQKGNKTVYEIQIGPMTSFTNARNLQKQLKKKGLASIIKAYKKFSIQTQPVQTTNASTKQMVNAVQSTKTPKQSNVINLANSIIPAQPTLRPKTKLIEKQPILVKEPKIEQPPISVRKKRHTPSTRRLWNLRNVDIRSVIEEVSAETGKNFVIDPRVQGKISIVSSTPIDEHEAYQMFLSALQVLGYAAVPSGRVIKIIPNLQAKELTTPVVNAHHPGMGEEIVVRVVSVKNVSAMELVPLLRPLLPEWGNITAYSPSNVMILAASASNVRRLVEIIHRVDTTNSDGVDMIPLHYATAEDIVTTLKQLETNAVNAGQPRVNVAAEGSSNTILISGNKSARLKMRVLISELDTPSASGSSGNTQIIYLHYMKAKDMVPILAGIAKSYGAAVGTVIGTETVGKEYAGQGQPGEQQYGDPSEQDGAQGPPAQSPSSQSQAVTTQSGDDTKGKPKVEIVGEPNTNSIIINAPPTLMRTLKDVISRVDIRPAQVLVEALIAEIDENASAQLGIKWGTLASNSEIGEPSNGNNEDNGSDDAKTFQHGIGIISKNGVQDIQAIVTALADDKNADILSTPSVVVLDNHQAKIEVGTQLSVQESTFPNNANGTTTATPYSTFSRENVALHLYVTPQISQNNMIQLAIDQGNDTLQNPENPSTTPVFNISSIQTSVLINSGDVLVLGGLIQNQRSRSVAKIPILGDIPIIGHLFSVHGKGREKRMLMVFLRPIILNQPRAFNITGSKYNFIRNQQLDWLKEEHHYDPELNRQVLPPWGKKLNLPSPFNAHHRQ